jgi:hypothetical protein
MLKCVSIAPGGPAARARARAAPGSDVQRTNGRVYKGYGLESVLAPGWWECSLAQAAISQTTTHMHGHHEATMGLAGV